MESAQAITDRLIDAAEMLPLAGDPSIRSIERWEAAGKFPKSVHLPGGQRRWRLSEILTWRAALTIARNIVSEEESDA